MIHILNLRLVYFIDFEKNARHVYKHSIGHTPTLLAFSTKEATSTRTSIKNG
jgi:hypothetical protein